VKIALIPPRGLERHVLRSNFHLNLAVPACLSNPAYLETYRHARNRGDYIVMDNGAAEGQPAPDEAIVQHLSTFSAEEVVLPDVLGNAQATRDAVRSFVAQYYSFVRRHKCMAVVQGQDLVQVLDLIAYYNTVGHINTLGLPRRLAVTMQRAGIRIDLANLIKSMYPGRFEIHFLGAIPSWICEIKYVAKYAPHVRSLDTSAPFTYAMAGKEVSNPSVKLVRPKGYLTEQASADESLLIQNIETLISWGRGA
jgi:hypothetical protein